MNDKMYLFGGYSGSKSFSDMHEFDLCMIKLLWIDSLGSPGWKEIKYTSSAPPPSYMSSGVIYQGLVHTEALIYNSGCLYIYGGDSDQMNHVWKFDFSNIGIYVVIYN